MRSFRDAGDLRARLPARRGQHVTRGGRPDRSAPGERAKTKRCEYWKLKFSEVAPSKKGALAYVEKKGGGVCASPEKSTVESAPSTSAVSIDVPADIKGDRYVISFDIEDEQTRNGRLGTRMAQERPSTLQVVGPASLAGVDVQVGAPDPMATGSFSQAGSLNANWTRPVGESPQKNPVAKVSLELEGGQTYTARIVRGTKRRDIAVPIKKGVRATIRIQADFFDGPPDKALDDERWAGASVDRCKSPTVDADCDGVRAYLKELPDGSHAAEAQALLTAAGPKIDEAKKKLEAAMA